MEVCSQFLVHLILARASVARTAAGTVARDRTVARAKSVARTVARARYVARTVTGLGLGGKNFIFLSSTDDSLCVHSITGHV